LESSGREHRRTGEASRMKLEIYEAARTISIRAISPWGGMPEKSPRVFFQRRQSQRWRMKFAAARETSWCLNLLRRISRNLRVWEISRGPSVKLKINPRRMKLCLPGRTPRRRRPTATYIFSEPMRDEAVTKLSLLFVELLR
jgi:hypothetical protein